MVPLGLAALLFCLFTVFGKAFLELVRFRLPVLRNWLIAPTVGFVLIEILVCFFNQPCNLPVKIFAVWMLIGLVLGSVAVLWWRKPVFPGRHLAPFGGVLGFSLLYTGWPALIHGFNWLSYVNGDMTYFSGGAVRMLDHPFYAIPPLQDLLGRDYTQYTWALHVVSQFRAGSEMLLAWCSGATGLNPLQAFMPLMLALQLTQLCAAGALVLARPRLYKPALLAVVILSLSPLFSLGTLYQLMPQAGGIPAMLILALLLTIEPRRFHPAWSYCLVLATLLSGLFLHYPEVIAFGAVSAGILHLVRLFRGQRVSWFWVGCVTASALVVCIMIREALLAGIGNTLGNVQSAGLTGVSPGNSLFPQYMVPSGMANLFGLLPIGQYPVEPVLSAAILIGMLLLVVIVLQTASHIWMGHLYACMLGFMLIVGVMFFRGSNDYGLFKLAMFCQPALAACFSLLALHRFGGRWRPIPVFVLAGTVFAQTYYTTASAGLLVAGVVEVPELSNFGLVFAVPKVTAISDINLMPTQGLASIVFRGSQVLYPSVSRGKFRADVESPAVPAAVAHSRRLPVLETLTNDRRSAPAAVDMVRPREVPIIARSEQSDAASVRRAEQAVNSPAPRESTARVQAAAPGQAAPRGEMSMRDRISDILGAVRRAATFPIRKFVLAHGDEEEQRYRQMNRITTLWATEFFEFAPQLLEKGGGATHLLTLQQEFLFNSLSPLKHAVTYGMFRLAPYQDVRNWLVFIPSSRGPDYYYERFGASFYQAETDPYRPGHYMSSVGSFFLLQVLHPTNKLRVRVSLSRSVLGSKRLALPTNAIIQGESIARLPYVGNGSGSVYSEAITPLIKDGQPYLAIDFGLAAASFPNVKTGLMRLYNQEFSIDHRRLVGFSRDISAVSEEEYQHLRRPRKIEGFPAGLLSDPGLEYSGIYEDGWVSQESFVKLGPATKDQSVIVEGMVPMLGKLADGRQTVKVEINDAPAEIRTLRPGNFRIPVRIGGPQPVTRVHLTFSDSAPLPGADGRTIAALVRSISIQ